MADAIREALERLLAVIKPKYTDPDEIVAVVRAMAAARATLAAKPPAPAPAADGEREELAQWLEDEAVYYEGLSTEASTKATRAAALLREAVAVDQKTKELITAVQVTYSAYGWVPEKHFIRLFDDVARLASALEEGCDCSIQKPLNWETEILELKARPRPVAAPTPDDFRRWWRETGSDDSGPTPEMLLTANAWAEAWAARCAQPVPGWQPIDTAPHDGSVILVSDYDAVEIVSWDREPSPWDRETGEGPAWCDREGLRMYPAWWQPLPDHPPLPQPPQGGEVVQ